jgi:hypothetical protein
MNRPRGPRYRPTPLWRDAQRFLVEVEGAVRQFPRYHQYTLGELRQQAMSVCRRVARAAPARDAHQRVPILEPLVWPVEDLKMSVQFGQELEALASFAPFQRRAEQAVVLGKQRGGGGNGPGPWSGFRPVQGELRREPTSPCAPATKATERQVESGKVHRVAWREGIMNRVKRGVWIGALAVIGWGGAPGISQAVQCQNNLPPSNPDAVYQDHGNGTVTDTRTGLMWKQCSEGQSWSPGTCSGTASGFTWSQALARAEAATFAGYADWRVAERQGIVQPGRGL